MTTSHHQPSSHSTRTFAVSANALRGAVIIAAIVAALLASIGNASASLNTLDEIESAFDTLGTTGDEWSGATYNADNHSLFVVDDEGYGFEFQLDDDDNTVIRSTAREVRIDIEAGDLEGVTWIAGDTYGLLSEDSGRIYVVDIASSTTYVDEDDALAVVETTINNANNKGAEGLTTDGDYYYVAKEWPPALHRFEPDGTWQGAVSLISHVADISGVALASDGSFVVLSDQSRTVTTIDIDWDNATTDAASSLDIGTFDKAEGVAVIGNDTLYVFGELSNQTYGHWEGDIVADDGTGGSQFSYGDANCSGTIAIDDAYIISQISVSLAVAQNGCSADANNDGVVNILDAYDVARCAVNHPDCSLTMPPTQPT